MTPRQSLPPCSLLTPEDLDIWVCRKWNRYTFSQADRLDADLMLQAQSHPLISWHTTASGESVAMRNNLAALRKISENGIRHYENLRAYALRIGGTTLDWPPWEGGE